MTYPASLVVRPCILRLALGQACTMPTELRTLEDRPCCGEGLMCYRGICADMPAAGTSYSLHMCSIDSSQKFEGDSAASGVDDPGAWHVASAFAVGSAFPTCPAWPIDQSLEECKGSGANTGRSIAELNADPVLGGPFVALTSFGGGALRSGETAADVACPTASVVGQDGAVGRQQCVDALHAWLGGRDGAATVSAVAESAKLCQPWQQNPPYICTEDLPKFS